MLYSKGDISFSKNDYRLPIRSEESESRDNLYYRNNSIVSLTVEILNGCTYSCDGCFVNRKNKGSITTEMVSEFKKLKEGGILLDELALGPVSFLSASNTEEVLLDDNFRELSKLFSTVEFNTAVLPPWEEELDVERILYLCSLAEVPYIDLELVIDMKLFMTNDGYVKKIQEWQDRILTDTRISTVYLSNFVTEEDYNSYSLKQVTEKVNKSLNAEFRYNLSFLRLKNKGLFIDNLKKFDYKNIDDNRYVNNLSNYGGMVNNHMTITYDKDKLYLSPVLNAPTNYTNESLAFELKDGGLMNKIEEVSNHNYNSPVYEECNECINLPQCIETFRMNIMRDYQVPECAWNSYRRR